VEAALRAHDLPPERIEHLYRHYGDRSPEIARIAVAEDARALLHPAHPVTEAELLYTLRREDVRKPLDFLVRRCNLAMLDRAAALETLPRVLEIMAAELNWDDKTKEKMGEEAEELLREGF
jgi:glycerol-3-phosphate dehydrogenase